MSIEVYFNTGKDNNKTHVIYNLILLTLFYRRAIPLHFHLSSEEPIWHQQNAQIVTDALRIPLRLPQKQLTFNDLSYCIENKFMLFITLRISSKVRLYLIIFSGNGQSFVHFDLLPQMNFNNQTQYVTLDKNSFAALKKTLSYLNAYFRFNTEFLLLR